MRLSKRIFSSIDYENNYYNDTVWHDYDYMGFHDQRLYEQEDKDRQNSRSYSKTNQNNPVEDLDEALEDQREGNSRWILL